MCAYKYEPFGTLLSRHIMVQHGVIACDASRHSDHRQMSKSRHQNTVSIIVAPRYVKIRLRVITDRHFEESSRNEEMTYSSHRAKRLNPGGSKKVVPSLLTALPPVISYISDFLFPDYRV